MAKKTNGAGAFDIRNVIGLLIGIYGVALVFAAFFMNPGMNVDTGEAKNSFYNLYVGIALLVVCAVFMIWAKLRPVQVPNEDTAVTEDAHTSHQG
ncbi:MAG: hypothetical protein PUK59_02915 [Actinomycetaceae bacterium]|nr:hypothetical protein [Actinomycetaceae bacterium]MDY5855338.1 hypothetical protein [Arcanobacterium sp.]